MTHKDLRAGVGDYIRVLGGNDLWAGKIVRVTEVGDEDRTDGYAVFVSYGFIKRIGYDMHEIEIPTEDEILAAKLLGEI